MTLVAITTLRLHDAERHEWRTALDERWSAFLRECGLLPLLLPNDPAAARLLLEQVQPGGVILSGGGSCAALGQDPDARDRTELVALEWARGSHKPVLGICRGMQVLLASEGARLEMLTGHVATRHLLTDTERPPVNSFHNYGSYVAPGFEVLARAEDGVVEWIRDDANLREGIMWHPEREDVPSPDDVKLFARLFRKKLI